MKKFLIPAMVMAVASTASFAASHAMKAEATWQVTANKDSSSAISITPENSAATINYNPLTKEFEQAQLKYKLRIVNGAIIGGYTVKASSTKNMLTHQAGKDFAKFDLSVEALSDTGALQKQKLTSAAQDLKGLKGFGAFSAVTEAVEYSSTETLIADFAGGNNASGVVAPAEANKLMDGNYKGEFNMIFDASWTTQDGPSS